MLTELLFPSGTSLQVLAATLTTDKMHVDIAATASTAPCSNCHSRATRIHSRYHRTLADLPVAKLPLYLRLQVRRFYCDNPACHKRTFSEPVLDLTRPFARRTTRLADEQRQLGLDVGGEVGARTAKRQGMPVSADTILRMVRRTQPIEPEQPTPTPTKLGIDDFALRKGHRYGTILVDLEKHCPVDLLPDRSAETLDAWLREHPGVQLIARDRASEYAEAAARAAPGAVQVADRFHLMQNVREMLQRLLERYQAALLAATKLTTELTDAKLPTKGSGEGQQSQCAGSALVHVSQLEVEVEVAVEVEVEVAVEVEVEVAVEVIEEVLSHCSPSEQADSLSARSASPGHNCADQRQQARRAKRLELYQTVQQLHSAGYSQRDIARQLHLGRHSVRRFVVAKEFPERGTRRAVPSILDPFVPYLHEQMSAGQHNGLQLWRQLRDQQGYRGSRGLVAQWVARHRHLCPACEKPRRHDTPTKPLASQPRQERRRCSARQAAFMLMRREEDLEPDDQALLECLCAGEPQLQTARELSGEFLMMIRDRKGERLEDWLRRAEVSGIAEIGNFVKGIQRDKAAVLAGLTLEDSSGQVEGQVNRLKFIKRAGYGRAKFDLLRRRVLAT